MPILKRDGRFICMDQFAFDNLREDSLACFRVILARAGFEVVHHGCSQPKSEQPVYSFSHRQLPYTQFNCFIDDECDEVATVYATWPEFFWDSKTLVARSAPIVAEMKLHHPAPQPEPA